MLKTFLLTILTLASLSAIAGHNSKISLMMGAESVSITEAESTLVQTDETVKADPKPAEASSVMSMNIRADYSFFTSHRWESVFFASVPVMSSATGSLWSGGACLNYYLMGSSSKYNFNSKIASFSSYSPYGLYAGGHASGGYITYQTVSERSADVAFSLGAHGGGYYKVSKKWSLKGELGLSRWVGSLTSSMGVKFFAGVETAI